MEIIELQSNQVQLIEQALQIYTGAFPKEERDPPEDLIRAIQKREEHLPHPPETFHFLVAVQGEEVLGIAIFNFYRSTAMGFIPYLAVGPRQRNQGIGAKLYQRLITIALEDGQNLGCPARAVVFEVERPELAHDAADRALRQRRIGFYQRNGALLVRPLYLVAPPMSAGLPEMAYEIMMHPLAAGAGQLPLEQNEIVKVVQTVLGCSYGLPADHPLYLRAIASIAG